MTIMDTRFTPEWLAAHPADQLFVDGISGQYGAKPGSEAERGEIEQLNARSTHDVWDRLGQITAPTFIGAGRYDGIAPLSDAPNDGNGAFDRCHATQRCVREHPTQHSFDEKEKQCRDQDEE